MAQRTQSLTRQTKTLKQGVDIPSKHDTSTQCCSNGLPLSTTLAQHSHNIVIGFTSSVSFFSFSLEKFDLNFLYRNERRSMLGFFVIFAPDPHPLSLHDVSCVLSILGFFVIFAPDPHPLSFHDVSCVLYILGFFVIFALTSIPSHFMMSHVFSPS